MSQRIILNQEIKISNSVTEFLAKPKQLLINGQYIPAATGETFTVYNPATGAAIAEVAKGEKSDIERAVKSARISFEKGRWRGLSSSEKSRVIWKIGDLILKHANELAELEALDNGKAKSIAAVADIPLSADIFHYMAGWVTKQTGTTWSIAVPYAPNQKFQASTHKEPIGVVGQIIPWNFPLLMAAWKLAPALASGCSVILKPAEQTPLSALRLGELMLEAGVPDGVINIVPGFGEAGAALAEHPDVDKVAFTGSTEVGKLIIQAAAGNLKKVSLELGGKSPNILFNDVEDLDTAIHGAASAIFFNHGQCCCAGSRLLVQENIYEQVVAGVANIAKQIQLGAGLNEKTEMGPVISQEQLDKICGYIHEGKTQAEIITGGNIVGKKGYFVEPTIIANTNPSLALAKEEIFGPVVSVEPFKTMEEVVQKANNTIYGLAAGVWTKDIRKANQVTAALRAGTVWVNCYNIFDASLPFGGYKQSGWGREMGKEVLDNYTQTKAVCLAV